MSIFVKIKFFRFYPRGQATPRPYCLQSNNANPDHSGVKKLSPDYYIRIYE